MTTSIRLDPEIEQRLDHLAAQTGRSKADHLREFIANGLEDLEDCYLAAAAMERLRKGQERIFSVGQVAQDLGESECAVDEPPIITQSP